MITQLFWGVVETVGLIWLLWQAVSAIGSWLKKLKQKRKRRLEQKQRLRYCRRYYTRCLHYMYTPQKKKPDVVAALLAGAALIDKQIKLNQI